MGAGQQLSGLAQAPRLLLACLPACCLPACLLAACFYSLNAMVPCELVPRSRTTGTLKRTETGQILCMPSLKGRVKGCWTARSQRGNQKKTEGKKKVERVAAAR